MTLQERFDDGDKFLKWYRSPWQRVRRAVKSFLTRRDDMLASL